MRPLVLWLLALSGCTPTAAARTDGGDAAVDAPAEGSVATAAAPQPATTAPADDALPPSASDDLSTRAKHLLEAVAHDDPSLATDIVFPRDAFIQVKDAADPGKVWDDKVFGLFQKQVHALHKRIKGSDRAAFVTFEIGEPVMQVVPKKHDLKRTLWRVRHSRLTFTVEGKADHFDVVELTSWRGAWYVTRLRGT